MEPFYKGKKGNPIVIILYSNDVLKYYNRESGLYYNTALLTGRLLLEMQMILDGYRRSKFLDKIDLL